MFDLNKYHELKQKAFSLVDNLNSEKIHQLIINALLYAKKYGVDYYVSEAKVDLANIAFKRGHFFIGVKIINEAITIFNSLEKYNEAVNCNLILAKRYLNRNQSTKAEKIINDINFRNNTIDKSSYYYNVKGMLYFSKKNLPKAVIHFDKALNSAKKNSTDYFNPLVNFAQIFIIEKNYQKASSNLTKALEGYDKLKAYEEKYIVLLLLAKLNLLLKRYSYTEKQLLKCLKYFKKTKNKRQIIVSTNLLAYNYAKIGKNLKAFKNYTIVYDLASDNNIAETNYKRIAKKYLDRKKLKEMKDPKFE